MLLGYVGQEIYNFTAASQSLRWEGGCDTRFIIKSTSNLMGHLSNASVTPAENANSNWNLGFCSPFSWRVVGSRLPTVVAPSKTIAALRLCVLDGNGGGVGVASTGLISS
jgi:hypothetical protein